MASAGRSACAASRRLVLRWSKNPTTFPKSKTRTLISISLFLRVGVGRVGRVFEAHLSGRWASKTRPTLRLFLLAGLRGLLFVDFWHLDDITIDLGELRASRTTCQGQQTAVRRHGHGIVFTDRSLLGKEQFAVGYLPHSQVTLEPRRVAGADEMIAIRSEA